MRILGFGTYDRSRHPRAGIVLDGFADLGEEVDELNRPLGFSTAERVAMLGRPWLAHRLVLRLLRCWASLTLARLRTRRPDLVLVGYLGHFDVVLARILFPRTVIALDLLIFAADTASDRGVGGGLRTRVLDALDNLAVRCADVVLVDTLEHLAMLPKRHRSRGVVVPVGAPAEWFGPVPEPRSRVSPLRVVFYGLYTPLQGGPVIGRSLALLAERGVDVHVTMVGAGQDLAETRRLASGSESIVTWHEWLAPKALVDLVTAQDVCLGIFASSGKGLRVTPNKVYQGAAAGCVVVTSDTPPQRRSLGDAGVFVPPGDPEALADTLGSLATETSRVLDMRRRAHDRARTSFGPRQVAEALRPTVRTALEEKHR